jgi:ribosome-associated translation inhibitor RaiA
MAEKKDTNKEAKIPEVSELDQLRNIVFGVAKADIEKRITILEQQTHEHFKKIELQQRQSNQNMQTAMEDALNKLEDTLSVANHGQDEKNAELIAYSDKISSELEMAEANSKQENDELHVRLDKEIQNLTIKFTEQLNLALEKLTQVSSQLNSSKTDRKTLAKLLATVASNLETDENNENE